MDWLKEIHKAELHIHLEGAIPHEALWQLIQKYGGDPDVPDLNALKKRFEYRDFRQFVEAWVWKNRFLREYEDFTLIARAAAEDLAAQNIVYAEMFYSPSLFKKHRGLSVQETTRAVDKGLRSVHGIEVRLICDLVRDYGPDYEMEILHELNEVKELGIIGIGIGGTEPDYPPGPFAGLFERARTFGFKTTAHAGEAASAESIWGAINSLKVNRIGHGTRAYEDEKLVDYLAEQQIPLEMCPISNVKTGSVKSMKEHPIRKYFDRGLLVTANTDDPKMFGNSLEQEYGLLESELGFTGDEIKKLISNGVQASWLDEDGKREIIKRGEAPE
jgi:adenosine deaminase